MCALRPFACRDCIGQCPCNGEQQRRKLLLRRNNRLIQFCWLAVAALPHIALSADQQPGSIALPSAAQGLMQSLVGLALVLAVILAFGWLARRLRRVPTGVPNTLRLVSELPLGTKERIALVEVADTWVLVGITSNQVTTLCTMPKQELKGDPEKPPVGNFVDLLRLMRSRASGR